MNIINLRLRFDSKFPDTVGEIIRNRNFDLQIFGVDYQVTVDSLLEKNSPTYRLESGDWSMNTNTELCIEGWGVDKKAKELSEAKEVVRKKQQEFKDAQRKLSELMGN